MAESRQLTTLSINRRVKDKIKKTKLKTVKDVLSLSYLDIAEVLHMNNKECKQFMDHLFATCCPKHLTALDMVETEFKGSIPLGNNKLDALLHGGLQFGNISEFVGPCGVGKTQWCFYASILTVLPEEYGGSSRSVIFIDVENTYRHERCSNAMNILRIELLRVVVCARHWILVETEFKGSIPLGNNKLDALLHGGLQFGNISEFVGPCGVGKTQWCFYASILTVLPEEYGGSSRSVIFIDVENTYRHERITEILTEKFPGNHIDVTACLSKIHVFRPSSAEDFSNLMSSLEDCAIENDVGLLVIDSIASLIRREITTTSKTSIFMRGSLQATWMLTLKRLAQGLNICVILTNQVATEISLNDRYDKIPLQKMEESSLQEGNTHASGYHLIPALGCKWSFFVNTRFILQYASAVQREVFTENFLINTFFIGLFLTMTTILLLKFMSKYIYIRFPFIDMTKIPLQKMEESSLQEGNTHASGYHLVPALGCKWSFFVNTRFILQYASAVQREVIIAKSPVSPFSSFYFTIGKWGISIEGF
ncbi:LOW QUALITY PROTEIN: DNA repair protein RAD51 homolog 2-like [Macrobrachium nipponense]|uniref:LOW QUALITY PROTEIN: DNA repair protein RAD51 homolog 2-like n=1 Tax=Macrobrachium nipponense TaxID=159736 RepID=UPI0030C8A50F